MQIEFKDRAQYRLVKRTTGLHLKFSAGREERPELQQLEAGSLLTSVGTWLTAPSMTTVEFDGTLYALFTQDLKERGNEVPSISHNQLKSLGGGGWTTA